MSNSTSTLLNLFANQLIEQHRITPELIECSRTNYWGTRPDEVRGFDADDGALFSFALELASSLDGTTLGSIISSVSREEWDNFPLAFHGCPANPVCHLRYLAANVICWRIAQIVE
jgi:hypothetical protein